jgi:hypothetical protein
MSVFKCGLGEKFDRFDSQLAACRIHTDTKRKYRAGA